MPGALYGVLVGVVLVIARVGGPIAWMFVWMVMSGHLAVGAILAWRRTRLPLMTVGFALSACSGLVLGFLGGSHEGAGHLILQHPYLIGGIVAGAPLMMFSEQWAHPEVWRKVKEERERATVGDILTFRSIPDLRAKVQA